MGTDMVTLTSDGHAQKLQMELARMREQHALCDLTIRVSGGVEYAAHKVVLVAHSRYFRMQMDCGQLHGNTHFISSVDSSMFAPLLAYLYTGQLHITGANIWAIITAATQLDIPDALNLCEHYLQNSIKPDDEVPHHSPSVVKRGKDNTAEELENKSQTSCRHDRIKESTTENQDSLYKIHPHKLASTNGSDILKIRITKRKTSLTDQNVTVDDARVQDKKSSDLENHEQKFSSDGEESDWKPNGDSKSLASRKKRKQTNPRKVIARRRRKPRSSGNIKDTIHKITHRKWLSDREKKHKCQICKKIFAYSAMLYLHQKTHSVQNPPLRTKYSSSAVRDIKSQVGDSEYVCRLCPASHRFWSLAVLHYKTTHMRSHPCDHCPYSSPSYTQLCLHRVRRHGRRLHTSSSDLFRCAKCPRSFRFQRTFLNHIRTAHNPGPQCENYGRCIRPTHAREKHLVSCYRILSGNSNSIHSANAVSVAGAGADRTEMRCENCQRVFKYQKAFSKHMASCTYSSHPEKPKLGQQASRRYECRKCQDQFPSLRLLQEHRANVHGTSQFYRKQIRRPYTKRCKNWDCEIDRCNFKSTNPHALTKHVKQHHPTHTLPCSECRFSAGAKILLERHIRMKHDRALQCDVCQRTFSVPAQLRVHKFIKHKVDDGSVQVHACSVPGCKYTCVWKSSLKVHMQRHEIGKPFSCQICDKKFKREKGMEKHVNKVHKGIRPYMCHVCGQSYGEDAELKAHMVRHNSTKQYKCDHCDYATHDKGNYQSHLFGMHRIVISSEMTIFTCNVCDYRTDRKHRYEMHMKNHMGIRDITCKTCGKSFVTKNTLSNHIQRVHSEKTYTCVYCTYTTGNQHTYKEHVRVMHTHRDIKPYKCAYCDFRCHTSGNCRKHCANRHKGLEIKWVRLCELYTNGSPPESSESVVYGEEERPIAESNIKHISIARRISKDVLFQQQQMEEQQQQQLKEQQQLQEQQHQQNQELQQQHQQNQELQQQHQQNQELQQQQQQNQELQQQQQLQLENPAQQRLSTMPYAPIPSFLPGEMPQNTLPAPGMQIPMQSLAFESAPGNQQQQSMLQPAQSLLQLQHLPMAVMGARDQDAVQMGDVQQPLMSYSYPAPHQLASDHPSPTGQPLGQQGQKHLTLL